MILLWLLCWVVAGAPAVHPWNVWLITLIVAVVLTFYGTRRVLP